MATYTTIQGDTWDMIAYRLFGNEAYMEEMMMENLPYIDTLVFSSGTVLSVPELQEGQDEDVPFWREDDDSEDEESLSPTEGGDDDE